MTVTQDTSALPVSASQIGFLAIGAASALYAATYFSFALALLIAAVTILAALTQRFRILGATLLHPAVAYPTSFVIYNLLGIGLAETETALRQLFYVLLGCLSYLAGYVLVPAKKTTPLVTGRLPGVRPATLLMLSTPGILVVLYLLTTRGAPALAADPNTARVEFFPNGILGTVGVVGEQTALIASAIALIGGTKGRTRFLLLLGVAIPALTLYLTANRGLVAAPALTIGLIWLWPRRVRLLALFLAVVVGLGSISYLGYERNLKSFGPDYTFQLEHQGYPGLLRFAGPAASYIQGTSETFDRTIQVIPSRTPYALGTEFFGPLLHKRSVDLYLKSIFGLNFVGFGLALGAMNAFYVDWGSVGIGVGFLLFGIISAWLYRRATSRGGRWHIGYMLWTSNLLISNFGHPFAYLSVAILPAFVLLSCRAWPSPQDVTDAAVVHLAAPTCEKAGGCD